MLSFKVGLCKEDKIRLDTLLDGAVDTACIPVMHVIKGVVSAPTIWTALEDTKVLVAPGSNKAHDTKVFPPGPMICTLAVMVSTLGGPASVVEAAKLVANLASSKASWCNKVLCFPVQVLQLALLATLCIPMPWN